MEKINVIEEKKYFINCPHCEASKFRVDHLFAVENGFGPWYCDLCEKSFKGIVRNKEVFIEKLSETKNRSLVFLRKGNALFVIDGMYFNGKFNMENDRYFYEEHTCPTNYINIPMIVDLEDGDTDPHGILEFVGSMPWQDLSEVDDVPKFLRENNFNV